MMTGKLLDPEPMKLEVHLVGLETTFFPDLDLAIQAPLDMR